MSGDGYADFMASVGLHETTATVPVHVAELHTRAVPVEIFQHLYADAPMAFLYESLEPTGAHGRYSFLGGDPWIVLTARGHACTVQTDVSAGAIETMPMDLMRAVLRRLPKAPRVAPLSGGWVGYIGYDGVRLFERLPDTNLDDLGVPDLWLIVPRELVVVDHWTHRVTLIVYGDAHRTERMHRLYDAVMQRRAVQPERVSLKRPDPNTYPPSISRVSMTANMSPEAFRQMVLHAKAYIRAGDIFQVVLSQRLACPVPAAPFTLYRALRASNPSPYMYYLQFPDLYVLGSSPETLVRLNGRHVVTRPLAGTRPRGCTPEEDARLAEDLLQDPKERAEHVMLVDLARNDIGRVCIYGTVRTTQLMEVEYYSRVMHMVSTVEGTLRSGLDAFDVFAAAFPAGTVSGAPKVRAMEIIDELEPVRRGIYAGAIGYFSTHGDMDVCIAIRTLVIRHGRAYVQAGAGIVADSIPEREYQETLNKALALMHAVEHAEETFPVSDHVER